MAITSAQLDELLKDWQQKLGAVSQNLYDLDNLPTYQRLAGTSGMPQARLTGKTQTLVAGAMSDLDRLFQSFELLRQTVDQAKEMRDRLPRFGKVDEKIAEIITFLSAESIELPVDASPLASRDLGVVASHFQKVTPISVLITMSKLFQSAAAVIFQVDTAWNKLEPQLLLLYDQTRPIETQIYQLAQQYPGPLPEGLQKQLEQVRSQIKSAQIEIDRDPIAAAETSLVDVEAPLNAIVLTITELAQTREQVAQSLDAAQRSFQRLETLNTESIAKFTELREKVLNPSGLKAPLTQDHLSGLHQWLNKLQTTAHLGNVIPVKVGLTKWQAQLDYAIAYEQSALTSNNAPLQHRSELRGRLLVLKAKAKALGFAEEPPLADLEQQVQQMLYSRPSDLGRASTVLQTYEQALNSRV